MPGYFGTVGRQRSPHSSRIRIRHFASSRNRYLVIRTNILLNAPPIGTRYAIPKVEEIRNRKKNNKKKFPEQAGQNDKTLTEKRLSQHARL